jgi:hypothetical protein
MAARGVLKINEMSIPTRIQRSRSAGSKQPDNTHYCGRPGKWGNPFQIYKHDKTYYRVSADTKGDIDPAFKRTCFDLAFLKGSPGFKTKKEAQAHAAFLFGCLMAEFPERYPVDELRQYAHLSCWCKVGEPCHVDTIIKKM